jgi:hypothetical protein
MEPPPGRPGGHAPSAPHDLPRRRPGCDEPRRAELRPPVVSDPPADRRSGSLGPGLAELQPMTSMPEPRAARLCRRGPTGLRRKTEHLAPIASTSSGVQPGALVATLPVRDHQGAAHSRERAEQHVMRHLTQQSASRQRHAERRPCVPLMRIGRITEREEKPATAAIPSRFRPAGSCAVRSAGPAQISPFWVLADHAIEVINRRSTRPGPSDRGRLAAF